MNLKEQIKIGWPFIAAVVIFILLVIFSTSGLYDVSDILFGAAYIILAVTVTYTLNKAAKRFQKMANTDHVPACYMGQGSCPDYGFMKPLNTCFKQFGRFIG